MLNMSEKRFTSQDIEAAAREFGYNPSKTTKQIRKEHQDLDRALLVGTFPSPLEPLARAPERGRPSRVRKAVGAVAAAGALFVGVVGLSDRMSNGAPTSDETVTYTVQPGDTANKLGHQIEAGQDGIAENEDARPIIDDIIKQAGNDGLQVGEQIQVPASADYDPSASVSLTHK